MDDFDLLFGNPKMRKDILFGFIRDRNHGIGHFQSCPLDPQGEIVSTPELFPLPRTEWLQGMRRNDERDPVIQLR